MCIFQTILKRVVPLPKIIDYSRFLFIGPHPDDIEIGSGATAYTLSDLGKTVKFLICTDGRYGIEDDAISIDEIITTRKIEAKNSAECLGVRDIEFLQFPDGGEYEVSKLTKEICRVICEFQPDIIFAPDPKMYSETHIDHINVGVAAGNAFLMSGIGRQMKECEHNKSIIKGIAYYFTDRPNTYFKINKKAVSTREQAICLHKSQFPITTDEGKRIIEGLLLYLKLRDMRLGIKSFKCKAECFRVLGTIHAHCAPESGDF